MARAKAKASKNWSNLFGGLAITIIVAVLAYAGVDTGALPIPGAPSPAPAPQTASLSGPVERIVDGDTLYLVGNDVAIRLWGVDAPERDEDGFAAATAHLRKLTQNVSLRCEKQAIDRYQRIVARCWRGDGKEINREMIRHPQVAEYCRYSRGAYGQCPPAAGA